MVKRRRRTEEKKGSKGTHENIWVYETGATCRSFINRKMNY